MADPKPPILTTNNITNANNKALVGTDIYDLDYFSGSQAILYIGDVYIDEATSFSFSVQQGKTPIYGYSSQLFDAVSAGNVLVQGQFSVNFKESGYLWLVLNRYKLIEAGVNKTLSLNNINKTTSSPLDIVQQKFNNSTKILGGKNVPFARIQNNKKTMDFISRAGIERLVSGEATKDERFDFYQKLAGYVSISNPAPKDTVFENIVEVFEDQVWQEDVSDLDLLDRRVDSNFFDDFDMYLVYGDYTKPGANHTVRRIRGVHLLGQAQTVQVSGEPISEVYSFFARNII